MRLSSKIAHNRTIGYGFIIFNLKTFQSMNLVTHKSKLIWNLKHLASI